MRSTSPRTHAPLKDARSGLAPIATRKSNFLGSGLLERAELPSIFLSRAARTTVFRPLLDRRPFHSTNSSCENQSNAQGRIWEPTERHSISAQIFPIVRILRSHSCRALSLTHIWRVKSGRLKLRRFVPQGGSALPRPFSTCLGSFGRKEVFHVQVVAGSPGFDELFFQRHPYGMNGNGSYTFSL